MTRELEVLAAGTMIDGCAIEDVLSSGGFGVVYRARHPDRGRVAIKVGKVSATSLSAQQLVWQQNEIEALTRLKHPSLVDVYGYGFLEDRRLYLIMELVEGAVLSSYLQQNGPLEALEAILIVRRIAEALAYCHASNILHLDLKPANIVITDPLEPRIKVLDFGLARLSAGFRTGEAGLVAGTLGYMAPECFFGGSESFSPKVDLYALGTIFYELLSCSLPFPNKVSYNELGNLKLSGKMVPLEKVAPAVPHPVAALINSMLAPVAARRYGSAAMLVSRLKGLYYDTLNSGASVPEEAEAVVAELAADDVPFIGRTSEFAALSAALEGARHGQGQGLVLVGEAGMGKSRLLSELLFKHEAASGMLVGYGRCRQLGELIPYSPLREALGQLVGVLQGLRGEAGEQLRRQAGLALVGEAKELQKLVPDLAELLPGDMAGEESEAGIGQGMGAELVGKALVHLLAAVSTERPLVIVLEDLHWADEGTLAILSRLANGPLPPRVLLLGTSRPFPRLPQGACLRTLALGALAPEENGSLLATLAGGADPRVVATLVQSVPLLATGNPLVSAQIVRDLQLGGYLSRGSGGQISLSERIREEYQPPDSVSTIIGRVLDRLDASTLRILGVAARIERRFLVSDLEALGLFSSEDVRAALAVGEAQRLVVASGDRCTFSHDTIREKLAAHKAYDNLADVHRRIAERLQRRGVSPGTLAYHREKAGELLPAATAYVGAGLEADRLHDPIGATQHLKKAFTLLKDLSAAPGRDDLLVRAVHELVRISCLLGNTGDTRQYLEQGAALIAQKTPEQQLALDSAYARAYYAQGNFPMAMEFSSRCLSAPKDTPALRAYSYVPKNIYGRTLGGSGKFGPAIPVLTEACALAVEAGEYIEQTHTEGILAIALAYTGQFEKAREHADAAARIARRLGSPVRVAASYFYYATLAETEFLWDEGVERTTELLAYVEENHISGLYLCMGTIYAGRHQFHVGQLERSRQLLHRALTLSSQLEIQYGVCWTYAYLGDVNLVAGRLDEAKEAYTKGLELANAGTRDELAAPLSLIGLAHHAALTGGSLEEIQRAGDEALLRLRKVSNNSVLIVALQRYAEALEEIGEGALAEPLRQERRQLIEQLKVEECDFWPRVNTLLEVREPLLPRQFWLRAQTTTRPRSSEVPAKVGTEELDEAETIVRPKKAKA